MSTEKQQLEELIRREKAIGNYIFDEERKCFFCDAEIDLYITKIADNLFKNVCYYMDGYEVYVDEGEEETYEGDEAAAKQKAIDSFNTDKFLGYPIIFTTITCSIYEDEV